MQETEDPAPEGIVALNVDFNIDTAPTHAALCGFALEMSKLNSLNAELLKRCFELSTFDLDSVTAFSANNRGAVLKPTNEFLLFVTALRAFNLDCRVRFKFEVEVDVHKEASEV